MGDRPYTPREAPALWAGGAAIMVVVTALCVYSVINAPRTWERWEKIRSGTEQTPTLPFPLPTANPAPRR